MIYSEFIEPLIKKKIPENFPLSTLERKVLGFVACFPEDDGGALHVDMFALKFFLKEDKKDIEEALNALTKLGILKVYTTKDKKRGYLLAL